MHSISKDGNIYVAISHVLYMLGSVYKLALKPFSVCSKEHSSFFIILSVFTIALRFEGVGMIIICDFFLCGLCNIHSERETEHVRQMIDTIDCLRSMCVLYNGLIWKCKKYLLW